MNCGSRTASLRLCCPYPLPRSSCQSPPRGPLPAAPTMAKPTSAFLSAGPSLVPSPVTATTCRCSVCVLSMMPVGQGRSVSGPWDTLWARSSLGLALIVGRTPGRAQPPLWPLPYLPTLVVALPPAPGLPTAASTCWGCWAPEPRAGWSSSVVWAPTVSPAPSSLSAALGHTGSYPSWKHISLCLGSRSSSLLPPSAPLAPSTWGFIRS